MPIMELRREEILDLVTEDDEVIGEVTRSEANGRPGIWHREVSVTLHTEDDRVLLQQRSLDKKVNPGLWTVSAAGHVLKGEDPLATAHTELMEELGFDTELEYIKKLKDIIETESRIFYVYRGLYEGQPIVIQPEEVQQARLFTKDEYLSLTENIDPNGLSDTLLREFWNIKE